MAFHPLSNILKQQSSCFNGRYNPSTVFAKDLEEKTFQSLICFFTFRFSCILYLFLLIVWAHLVFSTKHRFKLEKEIEA